MRRECRERFPPPPISNETAGYRSRHASRHVRDARAVMHVGIAHLRWRGKRSRHSRRMRTRNFAYLARGPWWFELNAVEVKAWVCNFILMLTSIYLFIHSLILCSFSLRCYWNSPLQRENIDRLVQEICDSIGSAMGLSLSCTNPSISVVSLVARGHGATLKAGLGFLFYLSQVMWKVYEPIRSGDNA